MAFIIFVFVKIPRSITVKVSIGRSIMYILKGFKKAFIISANLSNMK